MLKAVLLNFNGIIINDAAIHRRLFEQILLTENLRPDPIKDASLSLGRSDRAALTALLEQRGRVVTAAYLDNLIAQKSAAYQDWLRSTSPLPLYPGLVDLLFRIRTAGYPLAVVADAQRAEVEQVLELGEIAGAFAVLVTENDPILAKPAPDGYRLAVQRLTQQLPDLQPEDCLAVENTFVGITAAKQAGMPVLGVAHTYPYHMLQRRANWTVDALNEIDFDWIKQRYEGRPVTTDQDAAGYTEAQA
jgi:HAD superfamily hydrolase (TIGR01509 family)